MREIQSTDARHGLLRFCAVSSMGRRFAITRHGRVVAHLVPAHERERSERGAAVDRFLERRATWQASGMGRDEILEVGTWVIGCEQVRTGRVGCSQLGIGR